MKIKSMALKICLLSGFISCCILYHSESVHAELKTNETETIEPEMMQKKYTEDEIWLLPAGYAWIKDENGYKIITVDDYENQIDYEMTQSDDIDEPIQEYSFDDPTVKYSGKPTKKYLQQLLCSAAGKLPYSAGGRIYCGDFYDIADGVDNYKTMYYDAKGYGVDSVGLLYWAFRSTFGYTTHDFSDPLTLYRLGQQISSSELEPGDIGLLSNKEGEMNRCGICVGYDGNVPVFAYMNTMPRLKYPTGVLEIAELKEIGGKYFNGSAPVEFNYFVRLDFPWED